MCCRVVVQQCLKARLAVAENNCVEIGRGIVLFVSFLENATRDDVLRTAKSVLNVKLCDSGEGALVSVLELPGDVLVVPQACLAGKRKGNRVQYHGLVSKDTGQEFYRIFVEQCQILMSERQWCGGKRITTVHSAFGNPGSGLQENVLGSALSISGNAAEMEKPPLTPAKKRLRALDAFRGLSLVVMVFVNYGGGKYWFFHHSPWNGLTVADLVFPWWRKRPPDTKCPAFIRSCMVFAAVSRFAPRRLWNLVSRFFLTFSTIDAGVCGRSDANDLTKLRIPGVLQRFGISYLVACSLHLLFARPQDKMVGSGWTTKVRDILLYWPEWLVMLALLAVHLALTFSFNVPNCGRGYLGPGGLHLNGSHFNCTGGAAGYIDRTLLGGSHIYHAATPRIRNLNSSHEKFDYKQMIAWGCIYMFVFPNKNSAGKVLVTFKEWRPRLSRWCAWGVVCGIIGGVLCKFSKEEGWIPLNKNLWSVSYILAMASTAFLLLALFYYIIDVQGFWSGAPFTYAGMNSIAVYVGHDMVNGMFPWAWKCYETHWCYLFMNLWGTSLWVLAAFIMYRKGVFIAI
ncbi:unnamed protein product [Ixodes persulcatus]